MASQASEEQVQQLYIAYFGRPADQAGLDFYGDALDAETTTIADIATSFGASAEAQTTINDLTTEEFIDALYMQAFGRAYDEQADGTFWLDAINNGDTTKELAFIQILEGAQNDDVTAVNNKVEVAQTFTAAVDADAYAGADAAAAAKAVLDDVTADPDTVNTGNTAAEETAQDQNNAGETFMLTEALANLQDANAGVAAAAKTLNDAVEDNAALNGEYDATAEGVADARANAQAHVDNAKAGLASFTYGKPSDLEVNEDNPALQNVDSLNNKRLTEANLNAAKADVQAKIDADEREFTINDDDNGDDASETFTLAELQQAAIDADAAVDNARADGETDVDVLSGLADTINAYLGAGGENVEIDVKNEDNGISLTDLRNHANTKINEEDGYANTIAGTREYFEEGAALKALTGVSDADVDGNGVLTVTTENAATGGQGTWAANDDETGFIYTPSAEEQAVVDAVQAFEARIDLIADSNKANNDFNSAGETNSYGEQLNAIEDRLDELAAKEDAVADAEAAQAEANGLADALEAALVEQDTAEQWFVDNGYELPVTAEGNVAGTVDNDIFLFDEDASVDAAIGNFGTAGEDQLFFGEGFTLVALEDNESITDKVGDVATQEIFWEQNGNNVELYVENETFAGNGSSTADLTQVTLTGVTGADLQDNLANGTLTAGTAADIA